MVPEEIPGEIARVMKEAGRKGTTSPEQRRAWYQDCRYIAPLIRSEKETLAAANKNAYNDLVHLAQSWEQGIQLLEGEMVKCTMADTQVISPYAVQEWIYSIRQDTWIGTPYVVTSPENIQVHRATHTSHHAFLQLRKGQHVTAISPPIWVWADHTRLAGLWCIAATTYNWDPADNIYMNSNVRAGLVPISVVTRGQDL